jgi:saccharopine dehydrogenase-like NADP-dependent oxidoreductase
MPNKRDYKNSKIYAIKSNKTKKVYIGSTTQEIAKRLIDHRTKYKQYKNGKCNYITSFEIIKHGDAYVQIIELFPCNSKKELEERESQIIEETLNTVNTNLC